MVRDFYNRLRRWRISRNMTQQQLGAAIGCSRQLIQAYEKGTYPGTPEKYEALAKALGITTQTLLFDPAPEEILDV